MHKQSFFFVEDHQIKKQLTKIVNYKLSPRGLLALRIPANRNTIREHMFEQTRKIKKKIELHLDAHLVEKRDSEGKRVIALD